MLEPCVDASAGPLDFLYVDGAVSGFDRGKIRHEKLAVLAYATFALVFPLTLIPTFYSEVPVEGQFLG